MTDRKPKVSGTTIAALEGMVGLRGAVHDLVSRGEKTFVIDLRDLPSIDSSGIGELMAVYATVRANGGQLKLANPTRRVRDVLHITKLWTFLGTQPTSTPLGKQRVSGVDDSHLAPEVAEVFEHHVKQRGTVSNMVRIAAHRPQILRATFALGRAIMDSGTVPPRLKELMAVRTSQINGCVY